MPPNPRTFQLLSCIGEGGFGEVYRAAMRSAGGLEREVAVKTLKPAVALDGEALARLQDEARLLARLDHRAILAVHDLVRLGDRVALVTELLRGQDLKALLIGADPLPDRVIAAILGEVAGALAAASDRLSLVHRDIKPSNIHVGEDGTVKLLDFGIARSPKVERDGHTGTGLIVGTFGYLAPERVSDEAHEAPSDVYSLGCVLFAALTREPLYERQSRSDVLRISLDDRRHDAFVAERIARAPAGPLRDLLGQLLAFAPEDRPTAHGVELACEDLAASLSGPTLRQWARARRWPPLPQNPGALVGHTLSEVPLDEAPAPLESTTWAEGPDPGPRAGAATLAFRPAPEPPRPAPAPPAPAAPPPAAPGSPAGSDGRPEGRTGEPLSSGRALRSRQAPPPAPTSGLGLGGWAVVLTLCALLVGVVVLFLAENGQLPEVAEWLEAQEKARRAAEDAATSP